MKAYLDSSVVLRHILEGDVSLSHVKEFPLVASSELLWLECRRVLERHRLTGALNDRNLALARERLEAVYRGIGVLTLSPAVLRRAADSFPTVIGSLDAIHLSSALLWQLMDGEEPVAVFSFDDQLNTCARTMGMNCPFA